MPDLTHDRFAGLRNTIPAESFKPEDLAEAHNVDIDNSGKVARRAGQTLMLPGPIHSLWAEDDVCLFVQTGAMYRLYPNFTTELVALGLADEAMAYLPLQGRVYHSNGVSNAVLDDGRVRGWGIPIDQIRVGATLQPSGTLPPGAYQFAMTWLRRDGQESGCGLAARIDLPTAGGLHFTWSVPVDPGITQVALYLTEVNGTTLYQAFVADADDGQGDYLGGALALPLATQWYDAPPVGQCLAHFKGRIYIGSGAHLYATTPLGYEYCDLRDYRSFDGHAITVLGAVEGGLFVGTERALYFLGGASFDDHALQVRLVARCVAGSLLSGDGALITGRAELAGSGVVLLATAEGIVLGLPDGSIQNLTQERYQFTPGTRGAAWLNTSSALTQYLITMPHD